MKKALIFVVSIGILLHILGCTSFSPYYKDTKAEAVEIESPILIMKSYTSYPNSAGGVDWSVYFENLRDKDIKYITFTVAPYNSVGDMVSSEIGRIRFVACKVTGPVKPGPRWGMFENVWYNNTIKSAEISTIEIIYMDGETKNITDRNFIDRIALPDAGDGGLMSP